MFPATSLLFLLSGLQFIDVAEQAGLKFQHVSGGADKNYILETISGGVAWIDFDQDGWPDLYLVNGGRWEDLKSGRRSVSNALFHNNQDGTFSDVTAKAGVAGTHWGMGAAVADYDNDGWPDIYVTNYGPDNLYHNRGDGTFEEIASKAGLDNKAWGTAAAFADYDGDGRLDLYVTNYVSFDFQSPPPPKCQYRGIDVHCGPKGMPAGADLLYRNKGDGTFQEVSRSAGLTSAPSYGLGAVWFDFDDDGDQDLFVANDSAANFLYQNQGNGQFAEIGLAAGVAYNEDGKAQASMGVAVGDYDRDGRLDLFMTHFSDDYNTLYRNLGNNLFRDVTYNAGLAFPSWQELGWGTVFADFDNDGWEDLFLANGHIYPQVDRYQIGTSFLQNNQCFRNLGNGTFEEIKDDSPRGLGEKKSSRGAALADFDRDGDLDIAINNMDGTPTLLRNEGGPDTGHWISVMLQGSKTEPQIIGARVTLQLEKARLIRERQAGSSYQASHDPVLHFGLGATTLIPSLLVRWPSGKEQKFQNVAVDRHYLLTPGGTLDRWKGAYSAPDPEIKP